MKALFISEVNSYDEFQTFRSRALEFGINLNSIPDELISFKEDELMYKISNSDLIIACLDPSGGYLVPARIAIICGMAYKSNIPVYAYTCNGETYGSKMPLNSKFNPIDQVDNQCHFNLMIECSLQALIIGNFYDLLKNCDFTSHGFVNANLKPGFQTNSVYLAGPDIFRVDCHSHCEFQKALLKAYSLIPEHPIDNSLIIEDITPLNIFIADLKQLNRSEAVFFNYQAYAGRQPDDGTMFEIGYALAAGKMIFGYPGILHNDDTSIPPTPGIMPNVGIMLHSLEECIKQFLNK